MRHVSVRHRIIEILLNHARSQDGCNLHSQHERSWKEYRRPLRHTSGFCLVRSCRWTCCCKVMSWSFQVCCIGTSVFAVLSPLVSVMVKDLSQVSLRRVNRKTQPLTSPIRCLQQVLQLSNKRRSRICPKQSSGDGKSMHATVLLTTSPHLSKMRSTKSEHSCHISHPRCSSFLLYNHRRTL